MFLPGKDCPEKLLFKFFHALREEDTFWDNDNSTFTKQICFGQFPDEPTDTDGYKRWFNGQKNLSGVSMQSRMIRYWVRCHPDEVREFQQQLIRAYNFAAQKNGIECLPEGCAEV